MPEAVMEQIKKMTPIQKMQAVDYIWASLSTDEGFQFPAWHEDELRKTEKRVAEGVEKPIDWSVAKAVLVGMK